jgi:hypothetical protein
VNLSVNRILAIAALVCAVLSLFVGGIPWLVIAVILLALALLV